MGNPFEVPDNAYMIGSYGDAKNENIEVWFYRIWKSFDLLSGMIRGTWRPNFMSSVTHKLIKGQD